MAGHCTLKCVVYSLAFGSRKIPTHSCDTWPYYPLTRVIIYMYFTVSHLQMYITLSQMGTTTTGISTQFVYQIWITYIFCIDQSAPKRVIFVPFLSFSRNLFLYL